MMDYKFEVWKDGVFKGREHPFSMENEDKPFNKLIMHSDCDGRLKVLECKELLREWYANKVAIMEKISETDRAGFIASVLHDEENVKEEYQYWWKKMNEWVDMFECVAKSETCDYVSFH